MGRETGIEKGNTSKLLLIVKHWKLFVPYFCKHCKGSFVVILGNGKFKSFVPIEKNTWNKEDNFDKIKHKSHLLNCSGLQKQWSLIVDDLDKTLNGFNRDYTK